ncbi:OmpA family protein [Bernardetia sp. OM2101]|uniref:OmpA family protein n=1 Tax=Bernardetia sp. OM2101 TaxID=3344876 RepID=UPI0035D037D1
MNKKLRPTIQLNKKIVALACICLLFVFSSFFSPITHIVESSFLKLYKNWTTIPYKNDYNKVKDNHFLPPNYLPKNFLSSFSNPLDDQLIDGRFTIGYGDKSILFGYPYSFSTSHFVLQSSGKYASNNPELTQTIPLKGVLISEVEENSDLTFTSKVIYTYDNLLITQTLEPVGADLEDLENTSRGNYYKIEYEIENQSDAPRDVEFTLLLDPMIDANDICKLSADGSHIGMDRKFEANKIPLHFNFYNGDLQAQLVTKHKNVISPDLAYVGQWAYLTNVLQLEQQKVGKYTDDSAIMLRWNTKTLRKGEVRSFRVFYGVPKGKEGINLQHHQPDRKSQITIYFDANQSQLSSEEEARLRDFIGARRWKAALVEGYTDAKGSESVNLELSKDRISHVSYALQMFGIKYEKILRKSHGEFFARNDETARGNGVQKDRKVVVTVWR